MKLQRRCVFEMRSCARRTAAGRGGGAASMIRGGGVSAAMMLGFLAAPAHAYVDPSTGGLVLQLLLGGVAGFLLVIKLFWRTIKEKLGIGGKSDKGK